MRRLLKLQIFLLFILSGAINAQEGITSDVSQGCVPFTVKFAINTSTIDISSLSTAVWDFGNGETVSAPVGDTVSITYSDDADTSGLGYTVSVNIDNGAAGDTISDFITAYPSLNSDYDIIFERNLTEYTYSFEPVLDLSSSDTSFNYLFTWEHLQNNTSLRRIVNYVDYSNPDNAIEQYTYSDTGHYTVNLTITKITNTYTCKSSTSKSLVISNEFIVPNVFAPASSDYLIIDPKNTAITLSFELFSRTGLKVFEQEAPIIYWDGRTSSGYELGTGVYYYVISAVEDDPEGTYQKKGFIHLFR